MKLLLIESGGKVSKLKSILGNGWKIKATMGHIVELSNDGPDSLGFTLDSDRQKIECHYVPRGTRGQQILKELREAVRQASEVFLATDPDREGECISWHLVQQLRIKHPQRVVYTEITEKAVQSAIANPRPLDLNMVAAGRCRDTLDKLVGFKGSPLLWKLNNGAKSMGRVQSATLDILCQREREIRAFVPQDYWSVYIDYTEFRAFYAGMAASNEATAAEADVNDDAADPKEKQVESVRVLSQQQADQLLAIARSHPHQIVKVDSTTQARKPPAPFTTSSLQQAAGVRLKIGAEHTMKIAQSLYEQGHITYMRTDSVQMSEDYCTDARKYLQRHDPQNVPEKVARQKSKAGAQEAHEAIRPTHVNHIPQSLAAQLSDEELRLYELIWNRALASQCRPAELQKTRIVSKSGTVFWQARGQVVVFPGYTVYWNDLATDSQLPTVQQGQQLTLKTAGSEKKRSSPPPRYSEAKLVQAMEKLGIGRPSTYAPTVKVLRERKYIGLLKGHLQPTQLGMEVDEFLGKVLPDLIQSEFTSGMEAQLDAIAAGKQDWQIYLINWNQTYFTPALEAAYRSLGDNSSSTSYGSKQFDLTEIHCPDCERLMQKIPCRSKKLKADHFLKCSNSECETVMFWSDKKQGYELPYSKQQGSTQKDHQAIAATRIPMPQPQTHKHTSEVKSASTSSNITQYHCPVCSGPLELYEYVKNGEQKKMLRCSDATARRQDDHKKVAYFAARGGFWSPTYGEIGQQSSAKGEIGQQSSAKKSTSASKKQVANPSLSSAATTNYLCPVCSKSLEVYKYDKDGEQKKMLRCSDPKARQQDNHKGVAFFASKGTFWSPKYGEIESVASALQSKKTNI